MSLYLGTKPIADGASTALLSSKANVDLTNVNSSGTSLASGWAMPSSRYIDLTLGASGATYTAPANGWVYIKISSTGGWTQIRNNSSGGLVIGSNFAAYSGISLPVKKGDIFAVEHPGSADNFRFIYVEGEN